MCVIHYLCEQNYLCVYTSTEPVGYWKTKLTLYLNEYGVLANTIHRYSNNAVAWNLIT